MSVIKPALGFERSIRPYAFEAGRSAASAARTTLAPSQSDTPVAEEDERLTLARRIAELEQSLEEAAEQARQDIAAAREEGREKGRSEAQAREAERLDLLEKALNEARAEAMDKLEADRAVAIEIARATLAQILGDQSAFVAMVGESANHWKTRLANSAIQRLRVSREDFPDHRALQQLQARFGSTVVDADPEMGPGSCIFELELGEVDASIPLQAQRADDLLGGYVRKAMPS